jgi:hypothetical protein
MNSKTLIAKSLSESTDQFIKLISNLNKEEFEININNKWSAGQDLVHIIKLYSILNIAYSLPTTLLRILYGINKNEQRSYEQLQTIYKKALEHGAKSPAIYIPKPVFFESKDILIKKLESLNEIFIGKINKKSDHDLDTIRLPHPIIGKISLREMSIFTSLHTIHHFELLKVKLNN